MGPPATVQHRFMRSGVFDLRRKVLLKNFYRKQKLLAEMYDDESVENVNSDSNEVKLPNESQGTSERVDKTCLSPTENKMELDAADSIQNITNENSDSSLTFKETAEMPQNDDSIKENKNKKCVVRKPKLSRKRRRSSDENAFVDVESIDPPDVPVEGNHVEEECSSSQGKHDVTARCLNKEKHKCGFHCKLKRKFSAKRQYSFSIKRQCGENCSRNPSEACRVTRSMVLNSKNSSKRWKKLHRKSPVDNYIPDHSSSKRSKRDWFPLSLFKSKCSPDEVLGQPKTNTSSVSVQTEMTCFPELHNINEGHRNKRHKRDVTPNANSYNLRPSKGWSTHGTDPSNSTTVYSELWYRSKNASGPQLTCSRYATAVSSSKLFRSRSIQENVPKRVGVCRRAKSVYAPYSGDKFLWLHSCENLRSQPANYSSLSPACVPSN